MNESTSSQSRTYLSGTTIENPFFAEPTSQNSSSINLDTHEVPLADQSFSIEFEPVRMIRMSNPFRLLPTQRASIDRSAIAPPNNLPWRSFRLGFPERIAHFGIDTSRKRFCYASFFLFYWHFRGESEQTPVLRHAGRVARLAVGGHVGASSGKHAVFELEDEGE